MTTGATRGRRFRIGLAVYLALGFGAIAAVLLIGNAYTSRNTEYAIETLRDTEVARVPFARTANLIIDRMLAYDRAVFAQLQSNDPATREAIESAKRRLDAAIDAYVTQRPESASNSDALLARLKDHVAVGSRLTQASIERQAALTAYSNVQEQLVRRVSTTFAANVRLADNNALRRSFAELEVGLGGLRNGFNAYLIEGGDTSINRLDAARTDFRRLLATHRAELSRSPGQAWVDLMDEDLAAMGRHSRAVRRTDAELASIHDEFGTSSLAVQALLNERIAAPASMAVADSANSAAVATLEAQRTYRDASAVVAGLILLLAIITTLLVTTPVRRLIRATRSLAGGAWGTRAPRGGPRELDELAGAFNTMASQLEDANAAVERQQAELEGRVRARTRKLNYIAHHDALTALPNRRYGFTHLRRQVRRAMLERRSVGLLALDVDNFKSINDHLGHSLGDELLRSIADRLRAVVADRGFVARLGGDEFIIVVDSASGLEALEEVGESIVHAFRKPLSVAGRELLVSVSAGIGMLPMHANDAGALVRAADAALFRAKLQGRNRVAIFSPELLSGSESRFRMEQALRRGIEDRELKLVFQPQVSIETGETSCVEALVRWQRKDGTIVAASEFIDIAQQSGLIMALGDWVLQAAIEAACEWRDAGIARPRVAINLSMTQLFDTQFVERAAALLARQGLPPETLELELTETAFQTGSATLEVLQRAKDIGFAIALDDFGTGYSSLTSLSRLPLRRVKLDRGLIVDVDTNMRSAAIVRAICAVCHSLGLQVTVEGIERIEQLWQITRCGAVEVQGHLLAKPLESAQVPAFQRASVQYFARFRAEAGASADTDSVVPFRPRG